MAHDSEAWQSDCRELFARRRGVGSPQTTLPTVNVR